MDAYRVTARIDHGTPRRRRPLPPLSAATLRDAVDPALLDLVGRPLELTLAERWESIRERWSQTTFFLFDPDSWRS